MKRILVLVLLLSTACEQARPAETPRATHVAALTPTFVAPAAATASGRAAPTPAPRQPDATPVASVNPPSGTITPEMVTWLQQHAIPLRTASSDGAMDDLQPLAQIVGSNVRVVGLGESAYGMHEFFLMKQRVLQFLVTIYGYQALALEAGDDVLAPINDYLLTGRGEPARAYGNLPPPWNSDEMLDVLSWMRGYNTAHLNAPLRLFGFDILNQPRAMDSVEKYLDQVDPAAAHLAAARYDCFRGVSLERDDYAQLPVVDQVTCQVNLQGVYDALKANRTAYEALSSPLEYARAEHSARVVLQAEDWAATQNPVTKARLRAEYQAENINWLLTPLGYADKIVIWAHNEQVAVSPGGRASLGAVLRAQAADRYAAIGLDFYHGSLRDTTTRAQDPPIQLIPAPPENSYEQLLHRINLPRFMLSMSDLRTVAPGWDWLRAVHPFHSMLSNKLDANTYEAQPTREFDALIFFQTATPAMALSPLYGLRPGDASLPPRPENLDFEKGATGWDTEQGVSADSLVRHGGASSLRIEAKGSSQIGQWISASAFRGKRVRFSSYLKSDRLNGWAGLALTASSILRGYVLSDDMSRRPVRGTHDWQAYEIVFDVGDRFERLNLAVEVFGAGTVWVDDARLEVVGSDVPLTYLQGWPDKPSNLDFEDGESGWEFRGNDRSPEEIFVGVDNQVAHGGRASGTIRLKTLNPQRGGIAQSFKAEAYRGQRVRLAAFLKVAGTTESLALDLSAWGPYGYLGQQSTPIPPNATDWQRYEVLFDVAEDADALTIGIFSLGGQLWIDDVQFEGVAE